MFPSGLTHLARTPSSHTKTMEKGAGETCIPVFTNQLWREVDELGLASELYDFLIMVTGREMAAVR